MPSSQQLQDRQFFLTADITTPVAHLFSPHLQDGLEPNISVHRKDFVRWQLSTGSDAKQSEEYVQGKRSHREGLDMRTDQGSAD